MLWSQNFVACKLNMQRTVINLDMWEVVDIITCPSYMCWSVLLVEYWIYFQSTIASFWTPAGNLCLSPVLVLGYCSVASLLPDWRWTDTCIHHLSTHMVNTKLHIYHPLRYLLSWYIINKHKHDSMKNSSFTLLTRTGLAATFDLVMPSAPSHTLIQNSLSSLPSSCLTWPHFSERWQTRAIIESMTFDLRDRPTGWIWAHKWMEGKRAFGCKVVSLWRIMGQMTLPFCGPSN